MKEICPNLHNKQVAKEFGELKDLFGEDTAYLLWSKNNGYNIDKAPNGADSILFGELLHVANGDRTQALILKAKVYSDEFLKWFRIWLFWSGSPSTADPPAVRRNRKQYAGSMYPSGNHDPSDDHRSYGIGSTKRSGKLL